MIYNTIKKINSLCASLSGLILLFITFSIFIDVILRYFFNRPSIWITEVCTYLFLYVIFLGTSYALQMDLHIRVTFLLSHLPRGYVRWLERLTSIFCMVFSAVLLWQTSIMTWVSFSGKWTTPTMLSVPYAWIYVVMVVGSAFLLLTFIFRTALELFPQDND
ncbi:TRAP transporter small permease [Deltaproteobacteria bacterium]|nr:TRAP transporter small permease [Deltaproteobacteria bacterium]